MKKAAKPIDVELWKADQKEFDAWFIKQKYSLGAIPTWTQVSEMKRTWCNARATLREKMRLEE